MFIFIQGASKKMSDSDFSLKYVPGVGFYFFRGVVESEFCAQTIWALYIPIKNLKCLKNVA